MVFSSVPVSIPYTTDGLLGILPQLDLASRRGRAPTFTRIGRFLDLWVSKAIDTEAIFTVREHAVSARTRGDAGTVASETAVQSQLGARLTAVGELRRTAQVLEYRFGTDAGGGGRSALRAWEQTNARRLADGLAEIVAIDRVPPVPAPPKNTETALELPWRLVLSPNNHGAFTHSATQVEHNGRVELWHSRLGLARRSMDKENRSSTRTVVRKSTKFVPITAPFERSGRASLRCSSRSSRSPRPRTAQVSERGRVS